MTVELTALTFETDYLSVDMKTVELTVLTFEMMEAVCVMASVGWEGAMTVKLVVSLVVYLK
jgi:hypothetical protein